MLRRLPLALLTFSCFATGCEPGREAETQPVTASEPQPLVCAALRGNGRKIFSHFGSLARITETYGLLGGAAGGSSGSISTFITESIHDNELLHECGDARCSDDEVAARAALLFKATQAYFEVLKQSDEAASFVVLQSVVQRVREVGLDEVDPDATDEELREALIALLTSDDLRELANPEVLSMLEDSPNPSYHLRDLAEMAQSFGSFETTDPSILIRPGLVDFDAAAEKIGRTGTFFAGWAPVDREGMLTFFEHCATPGRDLDWDDVAALPSGTTTCGERLEQLVVDFRAEMKRGDHPNRIELPVGHAGFKSLVATSVLTGGSAVAWREARAKYMAAEAWQLDIDFDDVRIGMAGTDADLDAVTADPRGFGDAKTQRTLALRGLTWRQAIRLSPAEPGLARALEIDGELVSAGGWPDLHPVLALKNAGCDEVVYVTRQGEVSDFALGMANLMNAGDDDLRGLYDLDAPESAFVRSLEESDAVWCTNWDEVPGFELSVITGDAFNAPIVTEDPFFVDAGYEHTWLLENAPRGCAAP